MQINGRNYIFQDFNFEDFNFILTNSEQENNWNKFVIKMAPYCSISYEAIASINDPFELADDPKIYFNQDTLNWDGELFKIRLSAVGPYSVISRNIDAAGEKNKYWDFSNGLYLTEDRSTGNIFSINIKEFNPGICRFDLYKFNDNRVYVAADLEEVVDMNFYSETNPSQLLPTSVVGYNDLGKNMAYYIVPNFGFEKNGKIYNMQGWATKDPKIKDQIDVETGYTWKNYLENNKQIKTKQFNLGLYPKKVLIDWTTDKINISRHAEGDVISCGGQSYTIEKDERVIVYQREPININLEIDSHFDWRTSSWEPLSRTNGYFYSDFKWKYLSDDNYSNTISVIDDSWKIDNKDNAYFLKLFDKYNFGIGYFETYSKADTVNDDTYSSCLKIYQDDNSNYSGHAFYLDFNTDWFNWYNKAALKSEGQVGCMMSNYNYTYTFDVNNQEKMSADMILINCCNCNIGFPSRTLSNNSQDILSENFKEIFKVNKINYGYGLLQNDATTFLTTLECAGTSLNYYLKMVSETRPQYSAVIWSPYLENKVMKALYYKTIDDKKRIYNDSDYDIKIKYLTEDLEYKYIIVNSHSAIAVLTDYDNQNITYIDPILNREALVIECNDSIIITKDNLTSEGVKFELLNATDYDIEVNFFDGYSWHTILIETDSTENCQAGISTYSLSKFKYIDPITKDNIEILYDDIPFKTQ